MKDEVRVSVVQFAPVWLDSKKNTAKMQKIVESEAKSGSELIIFPELSNIGFPKAVYDQVGEKKPLKDTASFDAEYAGFAETVPGPTTEGLCKVTQKYGVYTIIGIAECDSAVASRLFNTAVLIGPAGIMGMHRKVHLPESEIAYFQPGNKIEVFQTPLGNIGMLICYDGRFPELSRIMTLKGAEIICVITASPNIRFQYPEMDRNRADCRAQENGVFFITCNRVGKEGKSQYLGHSAIAKAGGGIIAESKSGREEILTAVLFAADMTAFRNSDFWCFKHRIPELYSLLSEPPSDSLSGSGYCEQL